MTTQPEVTQARSGGVRMEGVAPPDYPFQRRLLREALLAVPRQVGIGWNRYDTDDEHVLHLWTDQGESFDIRVPSEPKAEIVRCDHHPEDPCENDPHV